MTLVAMGSSVFVDEMIKRKLVGTTLIRKISNTVGTLGPGLALLGAGYRRYIQDSHWSSSYITALSLVESFREDRWLPCTERIYYRCTYAIKNQRGASKIPPLGVFCVPKPLVGGFGCDELVLYGIRELA